MTFGLRCSEPACRPHPASLPVRVPTVESLPPASFSFASRLHLAVRLRLPSSAPVGSFHPTRFCPCWAHWRASVCWRRAENLMWVLENGVPELDKLGSQFTRAQHSFARFVWETAINPVDNYHR